MDKAQNNKQKIIREAQLGSLPHGWQFVPSGDPGLTRRLKASFPDFWIVMKNFGRKDFAIGICLPSSLVAPVEAQLQKERQSPEYLHKQQNAKKYREKKQELYQEDFYEAVLNFLAFHPRWQQLAETFARAVTDFTTPVGSGTVARTEMIPIEDRARAAVIAWMRHNTTDYDHRYIPRIAGKRHEVRREIAHESIDLLNDYRKGLDAPQDCPLQRAISRLRTTAKTVPDSHHSENSTTVKIPAKLNENSIWLD